LRNLCLFDLNLIDKKALSHLRAELRKYRSLDQSSPTVSNNNALKAYFSLPTHIVEYIDLLSRVVKQPNFKVSQAGIFEPQYLMRGRGKNSNSDSRNYLKSTISATIKSDRVPLKKILKSECGGGGSKQKKCSRSL
jgi:hypothetical protein